MSTRNLRRAALVALGLLATAGCAGHRTEDAGRLADAGVAFADSVPAVIDESFALAVTANSIVLTDNRAELTEEERSTTLQKHDELLLQRLDVLRDLKRHAQLLRSYFMALGALAQSDAATEVSDATKNLVDRLSGVGLDLSKKKIAGVAIADVIQPAVEFGVAAYQNIAIRHELEKRGHVIERELELERAALTAIGDQMMADKDAQIEHDVRAPLFTEYVTGTSLPSNWNERRIAAYRQTIDLKSLEAAANAAENLHQSWIAFSENRLDEASLLRLLKDVDEMLTLADKLKASS
jgi:hypothetical protein